MPTLNENLPVFECLIRREFLYNGKRAHGEYEKCAVFGVASVPGRALGFHCLLSNGAVYSRLPLHALVHKSPPKGTFDVSDLQLWDCPSEHISCITYDLLQESRCKVFLPSGQEDGTYMFTLDWHGSSYADSAGALGWKHAHFIRLDNGYFCAQPNNRVLFALPAWTKIEGKPDYALTERVWKCETGGTTTDEYFYEVKKEEQNTTEPWESEDEDTGAEGPPAWIGWISACAPLPSIPFKPSEHTNHTIGGKVECRYCHKNPCECTEWKCYPPTVSGLGPNFRVVNGRPECDNCAGRSHGCYCEAGKSIGDLP